MLRSVFWTLATVVMMLLSAIVIYAAIPTGVFFRPVGWSYNAATGEATLRRVVLARRFHDPLWVDWSIEIHGGGIECHASGVAPFQSSDPLTGEPVTAVTYPINQRLRACADNPDMVAILRFRARLFDLFPLRPEILVEPPDYGGRLGR